VIQLLERWDDTVAQQTFDARSAHYPWYAHVKPDLARLAREHGRCEPDGDLHAISRLAGSWKMHCERGTLELQVELTPTESPRVFLLRWTEQLPPDERMSQRALQLVAAIGGAQPALDELLASSVDHELVSKRLAHAAIDHGPCSIDKAIAGDGHTKSTFALTCQSDALELSLELDEPGQVSDVDLHRPRAPRAVCWQ
jgi:hypothetical protein